MNFNDLYNLITESDNIDNEYNVVAKRYISGDKSVEKRLQHILDVTASKNSYDINAYHGTSSAKQIADSNSFSLDALGKATGAASAKQAFFFAGNAGTSAEYTLLHAVEAPFGDWFWKPKNANDLLASLRDQLFGYNVSGQKIKIDANSIPYDLWEKYGKMVMNFFKAETAKERKEIYKKFRDAHENEDTINDIREYLMDKHKEEAKYDAYISYKEEKKQIYSEKYFELIQQIKDMRPKIKQIGTDDDWKKWSEMAYSKERGKISQTERARQISDENPEDLKLKKVYDMYLQTDEMEKEENRLKEEMDKIEQEYKDWDDLTDEEKSKFEIENPEFQDKVEEHLEDLVSDSKTFNIFTKNVDDYPIEWFEWERGFDPSNFEIGKYKLRILNPIVKEYSEEYRDESFAAIISDAKKLKHDGVIFKNIRDGGGYDTIYAVFDPKQIKSGELIVKDKTGNIIPLSKRFNPNSFYLSENKSFNDLYNLILEGDGDPLYDLDPNTLKDKDIEHLQPDVARKLSERDDSKREFLIKLNNEVIKTMAKSKNEAIGNIGYRLAKAANVFPNLVIYKMHQNNVKVFDIKWKIRY